MKWGRLSDQQLHRLNLLEQTHSRNQVQDREHSLMQDPHQQGRHEGQISVR